MIFHVAVASLKRTPILPQFHYWIAAWVAFGQIPEERFLRECLQNNTEEATINPHYTSRNYQDIRDWLNANAPLESFGPECLKYYPIKKQNQAEEKLKIYAEAQHRS
jgi:hypothetical protein